MDPKQVLIILSTLILCCSIFAVVSSLNPLYRMWAIKLVLFFIAQILFVLSAIYTWRITKKLLDSTLPKNNTYSWFNKLIFILLILLLVLSDASFLYFNLLFFTLDSPQLAMASFACLGFYFQFVVYHIVINAFCQTILYIIHFMRSIDRSHLQRLSTSISNFAYVVSFLLAILLSVYGLIAASRLPVVSNVEVKLKNFPETMNGFKILLISDIHIGMTVSKTHLEGIIAVTQTIDYDLLALVGDLTDLTLSKAEEIVMPLKSLMPKHGKYFVTGNHEYYTGDVAAWMRYLQNQLDFKVLNNSNVKIFDEDAREYFYLAGVDDIEASRFRMQGHGMDLSKATSGCLKNHSIIMMAHQPKAAKWAIDEYEDIELVLSGHTHGGQIFPMSIIVYLGNPFFSGLYRYKQSWVYVTQGAMYWGVPMRMFSQSEINLVHLFRAE